MGVLPGRAQLRVDILGLCQIEKKNTRATNAWKDGQDEHLPRLLTPNVMGLETTVRTKQLNYSFQAQIIPQ